MPKLLRRFLCRIGWHQWDEGTLHLDENNRYVGVFRCRACGETVTEEIRSL